MRERVRQFHGEMRIESDSSGTKILVNLPVPKEEEAPHTNNFNRHVGDPIGTKH
jgi:signal transduction histidine kinase